MGPGDYIVKAPFVGFHLQTGCNERFGSGEYLTPCGSQDGDQIVFRRKDSPTEYRALRGHFNTSTISPVKSKL
jgi:hypothetical protein